MKKQRITKRSLQAKKTRRLIFDTAMRLIEEQGYENITVQSIVKEAGVSVGTFYNYFNSKLDVYDDKYEILDNYFETKVRKKLTSKSICENILLLFDYIALSSPKLSGGVEGAKVHLRFDNPYLKYNVTKAKGHVAILRELIQQGLDNGELQSEESASEITRFFLIVYRGITLDWCIHNGSYDLQTELHTSISKLLKIYQKQTT